MSILITICARSGSKGVPGKNIKEINKLPLIAYSIEHARRFLNNLDGDVALSTNSNEIKNVASRYGLETEYLRPEYLAKDDVGKIDVLYDVLEFYEKRNKKEYDLLLDLDVTSPLRTISDLETALEIIKSNQDALNLFSVNKADKNPYFNMVEVSEDGFCHLVKDLDTYTTRQSAPNVYSLNASFYFYKRDFFKRGYKSAITNSSVIYEMDHECFDVDNEVDFKVLKLLIENSLLSFDI